MPDIAVLIADDHLPFRLAAAAVVEAAAGFRLAALASSGEEAVLLVRRLCPDLVLMDVHLPGIDGWEATRLVRALPGPPAVVVLSAGDLTDAGERVLASGALGYLPKAALGPDRLSELWRSRPAGPDAVRG